MREILGGEGEHTARQHARYLAENELPVATVDCGDPARTEVDGSEVPVGDRRGTGISKLDPLSGEAGTALLHHARRVVDTDSHR